METKKELDENELNEVTGGTKKQYKQISSAIKCGDVVLISQKSDDWDDDDYEARYI